MRFIIIVLITFLLSFTAYGCSCGGPETFCETLDFQPIEYITVKAVMLDAVDHGMDVKIISLYNGELPMDTIRVWGDNGILCRVYTDRFEIKDTIIMKLYTINEIFDEFNGIGEKVGDYELSICGLHYLWVRDNKVLGKITAQTQEMELDQFEELMSNEKLSEVCIETNEEEEETDTEIEQETDIVETDSFYDILLYPNPVGEKLSIRSNEKISDIQIYNSLGQNVYSQKDIRNNELGINFNEFKQGLYFVELVNSSKKLVTKKIYKK